jgi:putative aminopeptidase FrvX
MNVPLNEIGWEVHLYTKSNQFDGTIGKFSIHIQRMRFVKPNIHLQIWSAEGVL